MASALLPFRRPSQAVQHVHPAILRLYTDLLLDRRDRATSVQSEPSLANLDTNRSRCHAALFRHSAGPLHRSGQG